jgi:hypothetical protein
MKIPGASAPQSQMFLQTSEDVAVLGEHRLIDSVAFPVEDKSFAELIDFERLGNRFSGPFPMRHDCGQKLKVADVRP